MLIARLDERFERLMSTSEEEIEELEDLSNQLVFLNGYMVKYACGS